MVVCGFCAALAQASRCPAMGIDGDRLFLNIMHEAIIYIIVDFAVLKM